MPQFLSLPCLQAPGVLHPLLFLPMQQLVLLDARSRGPTARPLTSEMDVSGVTEGSSLVPALLSLEQEVGDGPAGVLWEQVSGSRLLKD